MKKLEMTLVKDLPYGVRMENAVEWESDYPEETFATASRIFHDNVKTLASRYYACLMETKTRKNGSRGQNRILSNEQIIALQRYRRDAVEFGYGAMKDMGSWLPSLPFKFCR